MSAAAQQQRRGGGAGSVADFGSPPPAGVASAGEYQLTELKNVSSARASSTNTTDFGVRLVQAVREHPSFYDAGDEHYGNRHSDASHRAAAWQQVATALGYSGDTHALSVQWRRLKERYTKERRKGVPAGEEPMDEAIASEMAWLDEYVLDGIPTSSSASAAAAAAEADAQQMYFMEGEELLGEDFVDEEHHVEYEVQERLGDEEREGGGGASPGSAHSGGSDIDVGSGPLLPVGATSQILMAPKELPVASTSRGDTVVGGHGHVRMQTSRGGPVTSGAAGGGGHQTYRFVSAPSHGQSHHGDGLGGITVSSGGGQRGNGTLIAHPKREGSVVGGGSTLTMVIDPTTYYQNGTQKMYRLVNVADLDQSQHATLQHLRPAASAAGAGGAGMGGGATNLLGEPTMIGRGTRKRMGAPLSPPSHAGGSGLLAVPSSSSADHSSLYGAKGGQLGDDLILDDGIVGENTIVIDHQRDDDSPLLVDSPGLHHHHMMMGGRGGGGGIHRGQHSPTLLGNGSGGGRGGGGGYSPSNGGGSATPGLRPNFSTSQYDADLALQHFISSHLARMNEDDKSLAKMNIQRILLDARFGAGTTLRVCMGEEDAELADAAVASEMGGAD